MKMKTVVVVLLLFTVCRAAKLPASFKKCDKKKPDFNKCLGDAIGDAIKKLNKPMPDYGLTSLDIIRIPFYKSEIGNETSGFHQIYSEFAFDGMDKPKTTVADLDFSSKTLKLNLTYTKLQLDLKFEGHGQIVLLPTDVVTDLHIYFDDVTFCFIFEMEEYGGDVKYWKVAKPDLSLVTKKPVVKFDQLFQNKKLNDEFNAALTEKASEILKIYSIRAHTMAKFFALLFKSFLEMIPVKELFDGVD